ncbi:MAG: Type 1 glutamine amidotransferase-like domain-containing protein [bacterium]
MNIIFLSNTIGNDNKILHDEIAKILTSGSQIAYIPSKKDIERKYFEETKKFFDQFGEYNLNYYGLEEGEWNEKFVDEISNNDAIYLSGGNTYYFLHFLKLRKMEKIIHEFVDHKTVIGTSAGGIVLTHDISLASDEKTDEYNDSKGFGFVDFYFYPHFIENKELIDKIKWFKFQTEKKGEVYAVDEKSSVIVKDKDIQFIGDVWEI